MRRSGREPCRRIRIDQSELMPIALEAFDLPFVTDPTLPPLLLYLRLVPVLAVGFQDLKTRVDLQHGEATRQRARLAELSTRLSSLSSKHSLSNSVRLEAISRRQTTLHHRLVGIARKSHLLIPALRGRSVTAEEDRLRVTLEACEAELEAVGGGSLGSRSGAAHGRLRARVNELWAQLGAIKAKKEAVGRDVGDATEWAVVDENGLEDVAKVS